MTALLASLSILFLATVTASVVPGSGVSWTDVCDYQDPTGSKCCAPGMEDHRYLVLPEPQDWTEHDLVCR